LEIPGQFGHHLVRPVTFFPITVRNAGCCPPMLDTQAQLPDRVPADI